MYKKHFNGISINRGAVLSCLTIIEFIGFICGYFADKVLKNSLWFALGEPLIHWYLYLSLIDNLEINDGNNYNPPVEMRMSGSTDLVEVEAEYHRQCRQNFYSRRDKPVKSNATKKKSGRRKNEDLDASFGQLYNWLEQQAEVFTLTELEGNMKEITESGEAYTAKWIETKLKEQYGDLVYFVREPGLPTKVCFTDMANSILSDAWCADRNENIGEDNLRVLSAAARLLLNEMRCTDYQSEFYPSSNDIRSGTEFLQPLLNYFMRLLVGPDLKQVAIGQCLMKAMRTNSVLPPLLIGLGVEVDHTIGSKTLVIELAKLGYSISYDEVKRYKQSVALHAQSEAPLEVSSNFSQWVADNCDHNTVTLDGKGVHFQSSHQENQGSHITFC